jgi:RimJ/RimL family protein N-acetyltransferase
MSFNSQPILNNDLVILRPLVKDDFEDLYASASDPLIWVQHQNHDRYTKENFTTFFNDALISKSALTILDANTNLIIGSSRFKIIDDSESVVEIGWSFLDRAYWGGVYNRSFKKLMINYALDHYSYVIFYVNPKNYRSQKAMEKLGATKMRYPEKPWVLKEDIGVTYAIDTPLKD